MRFKLRALTLLALVSLIVGGCGKRSYILVSLTGPASLHPDTLDVTVDNIDQLLAERQTLAPGDGDLAAWAALEARSGPWDDLWIVGARDTNEPAINVLDPFGNGITEALVTVEQGTTPRVNYAFTFKQTTYLFPFRIQRWDEEAEVALEWAAINLADQFVPDQTITLTFTATAQYLRGDNLASAGSPLTGTGGGFFPTVVQSRIQTGSPSVTKDGEPVPDGNVNVNFFQDWGYFGEVEADQFNYETTIMHEMLHAYGFLSTVGPAGKNGGANEAWSLFDKYITDNAGTPAISPTTYTWDTAFDPNLTGGDGGLFFYGTNEALAFDGNPVPLYTPTKWAQGSSVTHLDDDYFNNKTDRNDPRYVQLMNANDSPGPSGPDYLSSIEIGILKDLGYTMRDVTA